MLTKEGHHGMYTLVSIQCLKIGVASLGFTQPSGFRLWGLLGPMASDVPWRPVSQDKSFRV